MAALPSKTRADAAWSWTVGVSSGDQFYSQNALNRAYEQFFGRPRGQGGGAAGFDDGNLSFGDGDDVKVRIKTSREIFAGLSSEFWRHETWSLHRAVRVAVGQRRYSLPEGFDVLIDPAQVAFTYGHVSAAYSLEKSVPVGRNMTAFGTVGLGVLAYHARTHISSALIDTRSSISGIEPFLPTSIGVRKGMASGSGYVKLGFNAYRQRAFDLKISLGYEF